MKVTIRCVLVLASVLVPLIPFGVCWYFPLVGLMTVMKYGFGDNVAKPVIRSVNRIIDFFQDMMMSYFSLVIQLILGTRISYCLVDQDGPEHLRQHYLRSDGSGIDLRKVLTPPSSRGKTKIIIANHHSRMDAFYLLAFLALSRHMTTNLRIVAKEDLQRVPLLGWVLQPLRYLFLTRSWANDEVYLKTMISGFRDRNEPGIILIFPEGTDLSPSNVEKSQKYARSVNLPVYNHVLNPRTTGTVAIKSYLGAENVEEVIDLTLAYTYFAPGERPAEISVVNGRNASKMHVLVRRFRMDTNTTTMQDVKSVVPSEDGAMTQWILDRFGEKEQLLSRFYRTNPVSFDEADVKAVLGASCGVSGYDEDTIAAASGRPPRSRLVCCANEVGWAYGIGTVVAFWLSTPATLLHYFPWWAVMLVGIAAWYGHGLFIKRVGGLQRLLYLNEVSEEASWWGRWEASRAESKHDTRAKAE